MVLDSRNLPETALATASAFGPFHSVFGTIVTEML